MFVDLGFTSLQLFRLGDPHRNTHGKDPPENRSDDDPRDGATLADLSACGGLADRKLLSLVKIAGRLGFTLRGWRVGDGRRLPLLRADGGCEAKGDRHDDGCCFQGAFLHLAQDPAEAAGSGQPRRVVRRYALKRGDVAASGVRAITPGLTGNRGCRCAVFRLGSVGAAGARASIVAPVCSGSSVRLALPTRGRLSCSRRR